MDTLTLIIGSKTLSSWSLRPWLALKRAGAAFDEIVIPLHRPETRAALDRETPAGKVPALRHGSREVWESLAICEYVAELFPAAGLWPKEAAARAAARSAACEMHAGFAALRTHRPFHALAQRPGEGIAPGIAADKARITALWRQCRERFGAGGPFLFGTFTIADAMFAPVAWRFHTYAVELEAAARDYAAAVMAMPEIAEWKAAAGAER